MAKPNNAKSETLQRNEIRKGLTAATFAGNGKPGKPARPEGMSNAEWSKVVANMRVPKALKALKGIARLTSILDKEGNPASEFSEKQYARILSDIEQHVEAIREAFNRAISNPNEAVKVKVVQSRYFS